MGDALAGYVAARTGMLAGFEATCAVNENRTLEMLFRDGRMVRTPAVATPSPAMDISVPSNFERICFEVSGRDPDLVRGLYESYAQSGDVDLPELVRGPLSCSGLSAMSVSSETTMTEMQTVLDETGWLICPHTAVGTSVARHLDASDTTTVILSTAHAAKFPETVLEATGRDAPLPARCASLEDRQEVFERISPELTVVRDYIQSKRRN